MTISKLMKMTDELYTAHRFRSAFRDLSSEETSHAGDIAEAALARAISNKTEAAYRFGNLLEKRRVMMTDWADYIDGKKQR